LEGGDNTVYVFRGGLGEEASDVRLKERWFEMSGLKRGGLKRGAFK
jgi:hypothetical protein